MLIDLTHQSSQPLIKEVGSKAFNLHRLAQMNLPVPAAIAVPASVYSQLNDELFKLLNEQILKHAIIVAGDKFAVRSSGVGEDGQESSYAGIFESFLNVQRTDIPQAITQVWSSLDGARAAIYTKERATSIDSMSVVIQHMIDAEYAGVVFTQCPIERDSRIALLEVVQGNGDSLVSGRKTPATLRINKITGAIRISRHGADEIPEHVLESTSEMLMPFIEKIESEYQIPMDIEWAIADGKPYILQARPITA